MKKKTFFFHIQLHFSEEMHFTQKRLIKVHFVDAYILNQNLIIYLLFRISLNLIEKIPNN